MRISDWSSDVCSSDLARIGDAHAGFTMPGAGSVTRSYHRLGASLAHYLQLSGQMLPAAELVPSGFVTRVVRPDALVEAVDAVVTTIRSEEHTSELQSLMRISYAVFRLKKNTI